MVSTIITLIAIIIFVFLMYRQSTRFSIRKKDMALHQHLIGTASSNKQNKHTEHVSVLTHLSKKLLNGESTPSDLPQWQNAIEKLTENGAIDSDPGIAVFQNDLFVKYMHLHFPEDPVACTSVKVQLATLALWETYKLLNETSDKGALWKETFEIFIDSKNSNDYQILFNNKISIDKIGELLQNAYSLLLEVKMTHSEVRWSRACDKLLPRLRNMQNLLLNSHPLH